MNAIIPPVKTTSISIRTPLSDEILVNRDGSTAVQAIDDLAMQLASSWPLGLAGTQTPLLPTEAALIAASLDEHATAWVYNDPNAEKNGIWTWDGSAWRWCLPLPYAIARLENLDGPNENLIQCRSTIPLVDGILVSLPITKTTTSTPVEVLVNETKTFTIKTNTGMDIGNDSLQPNMMVLALVMGDTLRLGTDEALAGAILQASHDVFGLAAATADAANRAEAAAGGVEYPISYGVAQGLTNSERALARSNVGVGQFEKLSDLSASSLPLPVMNATVFERDVGKGGGAIWERSTAPQGKGDLTDADFDTGRWSFSLILTTGWSFETISGSPNYRALVHTQTTSYTAATASDTPRAIVSEDYPVSPGCWFEVAARFRGRTGAVGGGRLGVFWYDAAGIFLSSTYATAAVTLSTKASLQKLRAQAPAGAASGRVVIRRYPAGSTFEIKGVMEVYDVAFTEVGTANRAYTKDAVGNWWTIKKGATVTPAMLGAYPTASGLAATDTWYSALSGDIRYNHYSWVNTFINLMQLRGLWDTCTGAWFFGQDCLANSLVNIKNPSKSASVSGTVEFVPGVGIKGDGATGYIILPAMNELVSQNAAAVSIMTIGNATGGTLVSSAGTTASGLSINPRNTNDSAVIRLCSSDAQTFSNPIRDELVTVSRGSSTTFHSYLGGELSSTASLTSMAPTTDPIWILRSTNTYQTDTVALFMTFNSALSNQATDELAAILRFINEGMGGSLTSGPMCADIGRSPIQTVWSRTNALNQSAVLAARFGVPLLLEPGVYAVNDTAALIKSGLSASGSGMFSTTIQADFSLTNIDTPIVSPGHYMGGDRGWELKNMAVNGTAFYRTTGVGSARPGGSNISTDGASYGFIFRCFSYDAVLHNLDYCNTGILNSSGVRNYSIGSNPARQISGTPSRHIDVLGCLFMNSGDDNFTSHFSGDGSIANTQSYFSSGRHPDTAAVSIGFEFDDGSWNMHGTNLYARSLARGFASKSHPGLGTNLNSSFTDVTSERCGQGVFLYDPDDLGVARHRVRGFTYIRPFQIHPNIEVHGLYCTGVNGVDVRGMTIDARGDEDFLEQAIYIASGAGNITIDGFHIRNWRTSATLADGATVRFGSSSPFVTIANGTIEGAGLYGIWDSGSAGSDISNVKLTGTGVAGSIGVRQTGTVDGRTTRALKFMDAFAAGVSGFATNTNLP